MVGKYTGLPDAYKSLGEALTHGGIDNRVRVHTRWLDAEVFEASDVAATLQDVNGILVPGGFGERGTAGKIAAVHLRPRAAHPLFRHLLRHADGGDRDGAEPRRHRGRRTPPSSGPPRSPSSA